MKENITYPLNALQWETYEEFLQDPELTQHNTTVCMPFERSSAQRFQREGDTTLGPAISSHPMISATTIDEGCQRIGQTPTTVFYAAYALALAYMAGETRVAFYTMNHGREALYEVSTNCSSALYTQDQIDELSQITGDMALLLVDDQEKKLNEIIPSKK